MSARLPAFFQRIPTTSAPPRSAVTLPEGNLKVLEGLPEVIPSQNSCLWLKILYQESILVQAQGNTIAAKASNALNVHNKAAIQIGDVFSLELCERPSKAVKELELFSENSELPLKRGPRPPAAYKVVRSRNSCIAAGAATAKDFGPKHNKGTLPGTTDTLGKRLRKGSLISSSVPTSLH